MESVQPDPYTIKPDAIVEPPSSVLGPKKKVGWPIWLSIIAVVAGTMALGGIMGGASQALSLLIEDDPTTTITFVIAIATIVILNFGGYQRFEKILLALVTAFTATTFFCVIMMQSTPYQVSWADISTGLTLDFPIEYLGLALAVYGYTGVNSAETSAYTYWCIEKGYPSFIGPKNAEKDDNAAWIARARGWIKVLHMDVWLTLVILTCATLPFYFLGAGVLNALGAKPSGIETISVLSDMFTQTLGPWALWVFGTGAFFILFSTTLSAIGAGARFLPDYLIELGLFERENLRVRQRLIRAYVSLMPILSFIIYVNFQNPVALITIGGLIAALMLPVQSGGTLWLQGKIMDQRVTPKPVIRGLMWMIFAFQLVMAYFVIRFVVL